jgi:hypothetical protein
MLGRAAASTRKSIGDVEIHALEGIERLLRPDAVLLHWNLLHLHVVDLELALWVGWIDQLSKKPRT